MYLGDNLRINFDENIETKEDDQGEEITTYNYLTACVKKTASYEDMVEAIVAIKYPTYGAELAAIRKGGDNEQERGSWVNKAKELAVAALNFKEQSI